MPSTLTSDQMQQSAKKPVVLDLDRAEPPKRVRPPEPAAKADPVEVEVDFDPAPERDERIEAGPSPGPEPMPTAAERKRAAARRASAPPREVKPASPVHKENIPVRVRAGEAFYSVWNCAESPDESIRVNDERVLRFFRGTLKCKTAGDDEAVAIASRYAGGRYVRGEEKYLHDPIISTLTDPPTTWYSETAHRRHQAQWKRDHA